MASYIIIFVLFFLTTYAAFTSVRKEQFIDYFIFLAIILCCFAFMRSDTVDKDHEVYEWLYSSYDDLSALLTEPTFIFICYVVKRFLGDNIFYLFLIYAVLGVGVKMIAIKKLSEFYLLSALIYLSTFFLWHEMTEIRVYERNFWKFLLFALLAISFHYSCAIIIPLYFLLLPQKLNPLPYVAALIIFYIFHLLNIHFTELLSYVPLENVQHKMEANKIVAALEGDTVNVFNVLQLLRLCLAGFFLYYSKLIKEGNKYGYLLIKFYVISRCAMVFFADIPTFAIRTSELLGVVEIILLPCILYIIRPREVGAFAVMCIGLFFLTTILFYTRLLNFS